MRDYILFDLDGTLTDPALGITNSVMYALRMLGAPVEARSFYYRFIGPPLLDSFTRYCGFSPEKSREALRLYREYFADKGIFENTVYDGIPQLLADLQSVGYKLVVATSKPELFARQIFDHFDMTKYFLFIGGADMEETRATKDAVIGYVLEKLGNPLPAKCLMVGDREYDVRGAAHFGIDTVGVEYGYGSYEELDAVGAYKIADSVDGLRRILLAQSKKKIQRRSL